MLKMIQSGMWGWEEMVPEQVAQMVKEKGMFGYEASRHNAPAR